MYKITSMTADDAYDILHWRYEAPYDIYNQEFTEGALMMMLVADYYAVYDEDGLAGYFCIGEDAQVPAGIEAGVYQDKQTDIGIGLRPSYTGQGKGTNFFGAILTWVKENKQPGSHRLTVAAFNKRAVRLYEKLGFKQKGHFFREGMEFITMVD